MPGESVEFGTVGAGGLELELFGLGEGFRAAESLCLNYVSATTPATPRSLISVDVLGAPLPDVLFRLLVHGHWNRDSVIQRICHVLVVLITHTPHSPPWDERQALMLVGIRRIISMFCGKAGPADTSSSPPRTDHPRRARRPGRPGGPG